jgi:ATPase family AAA domain-containing protein 3A/B
MMLVVASMVTLLCVSAVDPEASQQYMHAELHNTTDSVAVVKNLPLKTYDFEWDSIPGRRHLGVVGPDAKKVLPYSVTPIAIKSFPNPVNKSQPIKVTNYQQVDNNQIFYHGLAATQQLLELHSGLQDELSAVRVVDDKQSAMLDDLKQYLEQEASIHLIEKRRQAEAQAEKVRLEVELEAVRAEEERRTLERKREAEEKLADYKAELDDKRLLEEDQLQRNRTEAMIVRQEESAKKAELFRRETEQSLKEQQIEADKDEAEKDRLSKLAQISAEAEGRQRQERENIDIALQKLEAQGEQDRQKMVQSVEVALNGLGRGFINLISDTSRLATTLGALVLLAAGVFVTREGAKLIARQIEKRLGRPSLVRETSRASGSLAVWNLTMGAFTELWYTLTCRGGAASRKAREERDMQRKFSDVILLGEVKERVEGLGRSIRNARRHKAPFRHLMLYGPPGTGKTMCAKRLALCSGLDYAIMSGGDVGPLGSDAVTQLHSIFTWANASPNGLLLFIDEAEAFLASRSKANMSEVSTHRLTTAHTPPYYGAHTCLTTAPTPPHYCAHTALLLRPHRLTHSPTLAPPPCPSFSSQAQRNALNALLYQTGEQSYNFMMVLATNRPGDLDAAVNDRVDEALSFDLPGLAERESMCWLYFSKVRRSPCAWQSLPRVESLTDSPLCPAAARPFSLALLLPSSSSPARVCSPAVPPQPSPKLLGKSPLQIAWEGSTLALRPSSRLSSTSSLFLTCSPSCSHLISRSKSQILPRRTPS